MQQQFGKSWGLNEGLTQAQGQETGLYQ